MDKDHNINLKVENKEVAEFTTPAKIQEWVKAVMSVLGMIVAVIIVGSILAVIAFMAWAYYQDSQPQKTQKPAKVQQAKPSTPPVSPSIAQKPAVDLAPWRQLSKNQSPDQVRGFLGEPLRVQGGNFTIWSFPNNGSVTFYENKVYMWTEPQ